MAKEQRVMEVECGKLKTGFGNPRKITAQKRKELQNSLEQLGDFALRISAY